MKYYAGLDVSMKETFICVVDDKGKVIREGQSATEPEAITTFLSSVGVAIEKVAIESGSLTHWLVTELQNRDIPAICIDAKYMSAMLAMNVNKTDTNDARGIANALRGGYVREVSLKSQYHIEIGTLLQARSLLVQERTKIKNGVRGLLKTYGIKISTTGLGSFIVAVREAIKECSPETNLGIGALLNAIEAVNTEIEALEVKICKIGSSDKDARLLMTIPGVGIMTSLHFIVALGDYRRFEESRNVAAYLGLTPKQYSSGDVQRLGGISKCGSRQTRSMLVEAATVMLTRTKRWCKPKAWAMRLHRKKGFKKAVVALGRKLAVIMHRMLVKQEEFRCGDPDEKKDRKAA